MAPNRPVPRRVGRDPAAPSPVAPGAAVPSQVVPDQTVPGPAVLDQTDPDPAVGLPVPALTVPGQAVPGRPVLGRTAPSPGGVAVLKVGPVRRARPLRGVPRGAGLLGPVVVRADRVARMSQAVREVRPVGPRPRVSEVTRSKVGMRFASFSWQASVGFARSTSSTTSTRPTSSKTSSSSRSKPACRFDTSRAGTSRSRR